MRTPRPVPQTRHRLRRNDARARRREAPAHLSPDHFNQADVQEALALAKASQRHSDYLGEGNFGVVYRTPAYTGQHVAKWPAAVDIHKRPWSRAEQRDWLIHEAGVANELRALGVSSVPRVVYVELEDGTPVLIREWGEPLKTISPREFAALETELLDVERRLSWRVNDDLQLYRRADGSVFVGDVGFWSVRQDPEWSAADSSLDTYGERVLKANGTPEMQGMPLLVDMLKTAWALKFTTGNLGIWINGALRPKPGDKPEQMLKWATGDSRRVTEGMETLAEAMDARGALGAPVPDEIQAEVLAVMRLAQNALEGYRRLAAKMA